MANLKISQLSSATTPLAGTETLPIVQSGSTKNVSVDNLTAGKTVNAANLALSADGYVIPTIYTSSGGYPFAQNYKAAGTLASPTASSGTMARHSWYGYDGSAYVEGVALIPVHTSAWSAGNTPAYLSIRTNTGTSSTEKINVGATGDVKINVGNVIQGTAAKGFNFTANTPAAGMTSQLLNWYEEGTWTPNQGGGLTVIGAFSSTGKYTRAGRNLTISGTVTGATSVALASAGIITTNLPFTVGTAGHGNVTNAALTSFAAIICTSTNVTSAGAIAATGTLTFSATYFV